MSLDEVAERKRAASRARVAKYRARLAAEEPDKAKAMRRKHALKRLYGMAVEEVETLLASQGNACRICGEEVLLVNGQRNEKQTSVVDHCHKTGKVRGILCLRCNMGLGSFRDNPTFLAAAIRYIKENSLES